MIQKIKDNIDNAENLELLYRQDQQGFAKEFAQIADNYRSDLVSFWKIRLSAEKEQKDKGVNKYDLLVAIIISLLSGVLIKIPDIFHQIGDDFFYSRNLAIIVFNALILYLFWQNRFFQKGKLLIYGLIIILLTTFLNLLPNAQTDSLILSFIFSPLFLWCIFGLAYVSFDYRNVSQRLSFIRFNANLIIMTGLILIAGGVLTVMTLGLFSAIKIDIESVYTKNIIIFGGAAAPIISCFLVRLYPTITNKIAPVIAKVFTPLVLITLAIYLVTLFFTNSDILGDRELLLILTLMLLAVLAIIVFSISELDKAKAKDFNILVLFLLSVLAIIINLIALTAIISRVVHGLTPNRTVVLGSNILLFVNLVLISKTLFRSYFKGESLYEVEIITARYLTVYFFWTVIVTFLLPFVFGFK